MDQLIELAKRLGGQMAGHQRTSLLRQAQQAVDGDASVKELLESYRRHAERISQLERGQKPIEVDDKRLLSDLEAQLSTNEKVKELSHRQVDFVEMTRKVKEAIDSELEKPAAGL